MQHVEVCTLPKWLMFWQVGTVTVLPSNILLLVLSVQHSQFLSVVRIIYSWSCLQVSDTFGSFQWGYTQRKKDCLIGDQWYFKVTKLLFTMGTFYKISDLFSWCLVYRWYRWKDLVLRLLWHFAHCWNDKLLFQLLQLVTFRWQKNSFGFHVLHSVT